MEDIEITKENYLGYKKLFNSKIGFIPKDKKLKKRIITFCSISSLLIFGSGVPIIYSLASLQQI